jgi:hypothetical protein
MIVSFFPSRENEQLRLFQDPLGAQADKARSRLLIANILAASKSL